MRKLLVLFLLVCSLAVNAQQAPAFWSDIVRFHKLDSARPVTPNSILFTGSSSFTRWYDLEAAFAGYPVVNRAFGGSTLKDVIRYSYEAILAYKPKQVVIYCGENDLAYDTTVSPQEVALRFKTLFALIRTNLPKTEITYVSIKPSPSRAHIQARVKATNKLIKKFMRCKKRARFINLYDAMLDNKGNMREELYVADRLHMKPEGYAIWQRIITPYLKK